MLPTLLLLLATSMEAETCGRYLFNPYSGLHDCIGAEHGVLVTASTPFTSGQIVKVSSPDRSTYSDYLQISDIPMPIRTHSLHCMTGRPGAPGAALRTGLICHISAPVSCAIHAWDILLDSGTATIEVWKAPTGSSVPTPANRITTPGLSITTGTALHSTTLTNFTTTTIAAGDILAFNLSAVTTAKYLYAGLLCR